MMTEVSIEEMVEFIYDRCADDLTEEQIEMVLELQQEFLDSKGILNLYYFVKCLSNNPKNALPCLASSLHIS